MRFLGEFVRPPPESMRGAATLVILRTDRGIEAGEVLCPATPQAVAAIPNRHGELARIATSEDRAKLKQLREPARWTIPPERVSLLTTTCRCNSSTSSRIFGGERIVFYFLSENRVDFRELVKSMARVPLRIELRQIGVRDEAKLLADYGDCGKPVCCNTHMVVMPPVSMRMAKLQKSTLDPTKISGRCGRLKCCLRFEQDVYEEFQRVAAGGIARRDVEGAGPGVAPGDPRPRLLVEFEDGRRLPVPVDEVLTRL